MVLLNKSITTGFRTYEIITIAINSAVTAEFQNRENLVHRWVFFKALPSLKKLAG